MPIYRLISFQPVWPIESNQPLCQPVLFNAEVVKIRAADGRVQGISLADGTEIDAPVVVNASGPHSFKINQMAPGVWEGCNIKTKALRHEVMYCPAPEGYDYCKDGYHQSDCDIGC